MRPGRIDASLIIVAFNAERFIASAIRSLLDQSYENFELIIVDDGSRDGTADIVREFQDPRIRLIIHEKNLGIGTARNRGIEEVRGARFCFCDADDAWRRERLAKLCRTARAYPDFFVGSDIYYCRSRKNGTLVPWRTLYERRRVKADVIFFPSPAEFVKYGLHVYPLVPTEVVRRSSISFRQEYWGHEWLCFTLELFRAGLKLAVLKEPLYLYRMTPGSDSVKNTTLVSQLKAFSYLFSTAIPDAETRAELHKSQKVAKHRLLTTAILEKKWKLALAAAVRSPGSIGYLSKRIPPWLLMRLISFLAESM